MGGCCGVQKQNSQKNGTDKNQFPVILKQPQQQQNQQQQQQNQQQQQPQNNYQQELQNNPQNQDLQKNNKQNIDPNIQNKINGTHHQQDEIDGMNSQKMNNQIQKENGQQYNNNNVNNNMHNIYSARQNQENQQINGQNSNKIQQQQEIVDQNQIQLQFNENNNNNNHQPSSQQQSARINSKQSDQTLPITTEQMKSNNQINQQQQSETVQQHQKNSVQMRSQVPSELPKSQRNAVGGSVNENNNNNFNQQYQHQSIRNQIDLNKGESIDNVEQILQNKPKSQERNSQNNRSSIHKETYQQLTNTIIARNDIYIFSNQSFQKQINGKKSNKQFELYCYFNEKDTKLYLHEFIKMQTKSTHGSTLGDLDNQYNNNQSNSVNQYSTFQDWTKLIEKHQAAQLTKVLDKDSKIKSNPNYDIFQSIIAMKERAWYDELVTLYKEKNSANKINMNMQETIFYKKLTIINDHFRWFVASVGNMVFNNTPFAQQYEFPPQSLNQKKRKTSSVNSQSGAKLCHSEKSDGQQPQEQLNMKTQQSQFNQIQMNLQNPPSSPLKKPYIEIENPYCDSLPEAFSSLWNRGFIWRGVYFRLLSKKKGKHIKSEMKALKHIGLEYLQNDTSFKISNVPNQSSFFINYILPLISYVETSSFILYATPFIYTKSNSIEEGLVRQSGFNLYGAYNNSYLLKSLKENNLRLYHKLEENSNSAVNNNTNNNNNNMNTSQNQQIQNVFYIINNARDLIPKQSECNTMFMINQDINNNIVFQKPPQDGFIEINALKQAIGYEDINFKYASLNYNQQKIEKQQLEQQQLQNQQFSRQTIHKLDQISFKKHGWSFKMIFMSQYDSNRFILNRRATDLLNIATRKSKDIKNVYGNVLIFGKQFNQNCLINPAIIYSEEINQSINIPQQEQIKQQKSSFSLNVNEKREIYLCKILKKQIESIVYTLDKTDTVISTNSLIDLFHKKGVNIRYNILVYSLLQSSKAKNLVGCDILVRVLKSLISEITSSQIKRFSQINNNNEGTITQSKRNTNSNNGVSDESSERNELFSDNLFKNILCKYLTLLIKGDPNNEDPIGYQELIQGINLYRLKTAHHSEIILNQTNTTNNNQLQYFLGNQIIKEIISLAQQNSGILILACQQQLQICISPDLERNIRNDKYYFTIRSVTPKPTDISTISFQSIPYLTIQEIAYLFLIKLSYSNIEKYAQIQLPSALYKISQDTSQGSLLQDVYYMPTGETLKNLISYLNCIFGNLFCLNAEQNFFLDLYIFQLFDSFFIGKDDEEFVKNVMNEKIQPFLQNSYTFSAEQAIVVYTWIGILQETKSLLECEQSYMMALLAIHKLYGDPRGRGSTVVPWELFILWRLSIVARLQGKKHDAEYIEELYDSIQFSMQRNPFNYFKFNHYIYYDPFKPFEKHFNSAIAEKDIDSSFINLTLAKQNQINNNTQQEIKNESNNIINSEKNLINNDNNNVLPFSHWTEYQTFDENSPIIEVLTSTLRKKDSLLNWMMQHLLIFQQSGVIWEISSLRIFQLSIMQNVFQGNSSCSSVSSQQSDKYDQATPKSHRIESKNRGFIQSNQSGNIVQILEKDYSTFSKKDAIGVMFSWGQNTEGQMGNVFDIKQNSQSKKIKVNFPKLIVPLKDTIVTSVACGYQHSIAITYAGTVLSWGDNSHSQLGLGQKAPASVPFPCPIPQLYNISSVSCGSEHTLALDFNGQVFSWGNGEGGLLGHGNEDVCYSPKVIESLKGLSVDFIVCGGLHSLVLTKNRHVYSWGRNEGGQLGIEKKFFSNEKCYLTLPKRVKGNLEGVGVIQIAAGEAHSIALALNGQVYGWGYNMNGQIGLGMQTDVYPVYEPQLIPKIDKIDKIYSGQTFSMFMNSQKEILCCGLNDSNQLGLEKEPIKITTNNTNNLIDQYKPQEQKRVVTDVFIPKKMDCFHQIPVLHVSCGHNHSLALVVADTKHYMLFAWGMNKHGQLGIGETGQNSSVPRPITYLQDVTTYSMACGSYHSLVVANDVNRILKKDSVRAIKESQDKYDTKWNFSFHQNKYTNIHDYNNNNINHNNINNNHNIENIAPSDEGKIDNPKSIQKANQFYALGVQFS